jgi:hypothetical protein
MCCTLFHGFDTLGSHTYGKKGPLTTTGDLSACKSIWTLIRQSTVNTFPLPQIDQIVDSTAGCELLCFLDAYSGYHQIKMKESDQLATSFIMSFGMFLLRNDAIWPSKWGSYIWAMYATRFWGPHRADCGGYIDDIVVKTRKADDLVSDLHVTFDCLRANG